MARNRKNKSAAVRFGPALKAFLLCLLIGGSGLGYVWQKDQINELGRQIKKREVRLAELRAQNDKLKRQWAEMIKPQYLDARVKELKLGLAQLQSSQICRLPEPAAEPATPPAGREQQFAAQEARLLAAP
ncbi:MAG TPA: hypothetical protein VH598_13300 [Verrucomicrobiae bacterium]|nr:hypothetical protein [Verrucomicrobiae bacterium]